MENLLSPDEVEAFENDCTCCVTNKHGQNHCYNCLFKYHTTPDTHSTDTCEPNEQQMLMQVFTDMLWLATGDGATKRSAGLKQPWWRDTEHEAAIFSHLSKWKHGELADNHSGAHPLVHLAWRCLAIAYQESRGKTDPAKRV
jgi:hypothetical protein